MRWEKGTASFLSRLLLIFILHTFGLTATADNSLRAGHERLVNHLLRDFKQNGGNHLSPAADLLFETVFFRSHTSIILPILESICPLPDTAEQEHSNLSPAGRLLCSYLYLCAGQGIKRGDDGEGGGVRFDNMRVVTPSHLLRASFVLEYFTNLHSHSRPLPSELKSTEKTPSLLQFEGAWHSFFQCQSKGSWCIPSSLSGSLFQQLGKASTLLPDICHKSDFKAFLSEGALLLALIPHILRSEDGSFRSTIFAAQAFVSGGSAEGGIELLQRVPFLKVRDRGHNGESSTMEEINVEKSNSLAGVARCLYFRACTTSCQEGMIAEEIKRALAWMEQVQEEVEMHSRSTSHGEDDSRQVEMWRAVHKMWSSPPAHIADVVDCIAPFDALLLPFGGGVFPHFVATYHAHRILARAAHISPTLPNFSHSSLLERDLSSTSPLRIALITSDFGDNSVGRELLALLQATSRLSSASSTSARRGENDDNKNDPLSFYIVGGRRIVFSCWMIDQGEKRTASATLGVVKATQSLCSEGTMHTYNRKSDPIQLATDLNTDSTGVTVDVDVWMPSRYRSKAGVYTGDALSLQPAPLQVSFKNFVGSSGQPWLTHLLADAIVAPPEFATPRQFSEHVLLVPHSFYLMEGYTSHYDPRTKVRKVDEEGDIGALQILSRVTSMGRTSSCEVEVPTNARARENLVQGSGEGVMPWSHCVDELTNATSLLSEALEDEKFMRCAERVVVAAAFHNHRKLDQQSRSLMMTAMDAISDVMQQEQGESKHPLEQEGVREKWEGNENRSSPSHPFPFFWTFRNPASCSSHILNSTLSTTLTSRSQKEGEQKHEGCELDGGRVTHTDKRISPSQFLLSELFPRRCHLAIKRFATIGLDPLHYNGHSATADLLFAGVPVVTFPRERFAARVTASLLTSVGLTQFIARSQFEYAHIAQEYVRSTLNPSEREKARGSQATPSSLHRTAVRSHLDALALDEKGPFNTSEWTLHFIRTLTLLFDSHVSGDAKRYHIRTVDVQE
uniref:O-GlcNAc transferase C-terminal domain-containing protein n=1 Tax=Palpitomonas bilix TaxID=652834 RepID=A0A7S3GBR8_9EUKA|mmetsp:Transcript_40736/g.105724  ORF Transcript_40736/g.105724 Transcript_40736/m.105724 type:complete len:1017 (+) Transcript_40736:357-3407(+)